MYVCDYEHGSESRPADVWTQDCDGKWTPLCGSCLPEFWVGGDKENGPWVVYPIHFVPAGEKRLKEGYIRVRRDGVVHVEYNPEVAALFLKMRELDRQIIRDCTEHLLG